MKDELPPLEIRPHQYERPNQDWMCGKSAEGTPCRIGPDGKGRCRAEAECKPVLEIKAGESKGRWRCTRTAEFGGPCEGGPRSDGACSRPVTRCVPIRTLRARRKIFTLSVAAFTAGILLIGLCGPFRTQFLNPGELSSQHATAAFAAMAGTNSAGGCAACHDSANVGPSGWISAAFNARPGPHHIGALASAEPPAMTVIDSNCQKCHRAHAFHQPTVTRDHSCSACHREHQGSGLMPAPTDANCLSCHANPEVMEASAELGRTMPASAFDFRPEQGRVLFKAPRPERGYTKPIHSFATDHPEFQILADKLEDPNRLKFNHELHLTSPNVAPLSGGKLQCADCHKPDAAGVYYLKITYDQNCQSCHSLQFDVHNPDLRIPHGDAEHVRAFLRSLPAQYRDHASQEKGIRGERELETFVQQQTAQLREQFGSGEELERRVFFSDARSGPVARSGGLDSVGAARFPGCAYCHEVTASDAGVPVVSRPSIPDRWLIRGAFDHSKHFKLDCAHCHDAATSRETADILLPSRQSCVECHSPKGGVAHNCSTCHSFHTPNVLKAESDF